MAETEEQQGPKDQAGAHCLPVLTGMGRGLGAVLWQHQAAPRPAGPCPSPGLGEVGSDVLGSSTLAFALVMQFRGNADANFT